MSSKFATPFFQKSPLYGAYTSGADGMVTVSDAKHFAKLQSDAAGIVEKAYASKETPCDNLVQKLSENKISNAAYKTLSAKCAEQNNKNEDSNTGSFENVTGKKPFEGQTSLSDYKKSNKDNPFYPGQSNKVFTPIEIPEISRSKIIIK
tara:strand:+ start:20 stop:466 length:447 start_codon:yes stop_codon:yes gene_type:complete